MLQKKISHQKFQKNLVGAVGNRRTMAGPSSLVAPLYGDFLQPTEQGGLFDATPESDEDDAADVHDTSELELNLTFAKKQLQAVELLCMKGSNEKCRMWSFYA
eukprot:g21315.t1